MPIELPAHPSQATAEAVARTAPRLAPALASVGRERELRLDLFRGMALWLIFIDHLPTNILTWLTIRNYGFSDATEIFIFISGYTAAFVYGRAMLESGFVVASARIMRRVWQIYVAHVFLFTIFLAEISYVATSFENPLYIEEMGIMDFLKQPDVTIVQALLLQIPSRQHGRAAALYRADGCFCPDPVADEVANRRRRWRCRSLLYALTWQFDWHLSAYPNGVLGLQSVRLATAVRVRRVVRARRRRAECRGSCRRRSRCGSASPICSPRSSSR